MRGGNPGGQGLVNIPDGLFSLPSTAADMDKTAIKQGNRYK